MDEKLIKIIECPECKGKLLFNENDLICTKCKKKYSIRKGIPVFMKNVVANDNISYGSFRSKLLKYPRFFKTFEKVHRVVGPPITTYEKTEKVFGTKIPSSLSSLIKNNKKGLILNVGSSSKKVYPNTINLDIGVYDNVDIVADGKKMPFKDKTFDIVLVEMVLEHVDDPDEIIREAYRVLKNGGKIYVSIPFVFAFHGSPDDYNRFTVRGLARRLEKQGFKTEKVDVLSGPSSTMSQVLRYYLAMLLSFNSNFLFSFWLNVFGWITFPIKYLDIFMNKHNKAYILAATIYGVGRK